MSYEVIRHAAVQNVFKFMKVTPDAVYFQSPNGSNQLVVRLGDKFKSARGADVLAAIRNDTIKRGHKVTSEELTKAAQAYIEQSGTVKHSDDNPDVLTEDEIEIIDAPYPKDPQMPRGNAAMRPFDYNDTGVYPRDYTEGSLQHSEELWHHGILGMKWGVRRYQNADGSLTEAGRKRYIDEKYRQSRTSYERDLNEKLKGKSKIEQTKIIRQESRDLAEARANRANKHTKQVVGAAAIGGTAAGTAGGLFGASLGSLGGPAGAFIGAYAGAVVSTVASSIAISLGEQFLYSERNRSKNNLLSMKYDELNIDEATKKRLNL